METIDLEKDPYYFRNHIGKIECRLCLTLHDNEGSYLAHTQGKRHQQNLAKRAALEQKDHPIAPVVKAKARAAPAACPRSTSLPSACMACSPTGPGLTCAARLSRRGG